MYSIALLNYNGQYPTRKHVCLSLLNSGILRTRLSLPIQIPGVFFWDMWGFGAMLGRTKKPPGKKNLGPNLGVLLLLEGLCRYQNRRYFALQLQLVFIHSNRFNFLSCSSMFRLDRIGKSYEYWIRKELQGHLWLTQAAEVLLRQFERLCDSKQRMSIVI